MAKEKIEELESDWAFSEKLQKEMHISQAESGLKGYRCLGCHAQMVANIQKKNPHWHSYFSHHASDVNKEKTECVRASKVYREKIARAILNRLKYVNAPAIYKDSPKSELDLLPMKIENRKKITASYTKAELSFYEDENGNVKWGKNSESSDKNLLIRPDVTFFNNEDKPILFIEFIVKNKITQEKFLKLSRIGIDTLQIIIPSKSEEEIEKALKSSRTYKWVHNEKEANTEYIPVPRRNSEEFSQINENERIIFEEDFRCRQAEINQLIRSIKGSLRSEQYRRIELDLNQKIQQVERNTETAEQRLADLEESNRREAFSRNSNEEEYEDNKYTGLERRYFAEKRRLERVLETASINQHHRSKIIKSIENEETEIRRIEQESIDFEVEIKERLQNQFGVAVEREKKEINNLEETIRISINTELLAANSVNKSLGISYNGIQRRTAREFEFVKREEKSGIDKLKKEENCLGGAVFEKYRKPIEHEESEIERIRRKTENCFESVSQKFHIDLKHNKESLPQELRDLFQEQRFINDYEDAQRKEDCYKAARKFLGKRTWRKE